jgi:molecular chaperone GrpE
MADQDSTQQADGEAQGDDTNSLDALKKKVEDAQRQEQATVHTEYGEKIAELEKAKLEAEAKAIRALADLQNARKRMEEEKATFAVFAAQSLVLKVLDIYENYHRLMLHKPEWVNEEMKKQGNEEWLKGLDLIDQQFQKFLEEQGVDVLEAKVGEKIDPTKHEAVMSGDGEAGVILEVFSPGYEMGGRVIKTAKVKVGKG